MASFPVDRLVCKSDPSDLPEIDLSDLNREEKEHSKTLFSKIQHATVYINAYSVHNHWEHIVND